MSKTAAIKHTKLYTCHPQKFQTFKIRTLPTPQPKDLILFFFAWGGKKPWGAFCFVFGSSKNKTKTLFQGYVGVFFDEEGITKAFRCAYIPSCIVPSDFQAFFDTPPSSISRCSPAKKTTQPVVRPFFWGGFFFWKAPAVLRFSFSVACPSTNPMKCVGNLRIPR